MRDALVEYLRKRVARRQFHVTRHAQARAHERSIRIASICSAARARRFAWQRTDLGSRGDIRITVSCLLEQQRARAVFGISPDLRLIELITVMWGGEPS